MWSSIYTYTYFLRVKFSQLILDHEKHKNYPLPPRKIPAIWYVALIIGSLSEGSLLKTTHSVDLVAIVRNSEKFVYIHLRMWPTRVVLYVLNSYREQTSEDSTDEHVQIP